MQQDEVDKFLPKVIRLFSKEIFSQETTQESESVLLTSMLPTLQI